MKGFSCLSKIDRLKDNRTTEEIMINMILAAVSLFINV